MNDGAAPFWIVACRCLAAALCALVLLTGSLSAHADARVAPTGFDRDPTSVAGPAYDGGAIAWRSILGGAGGEADREAVPDAALCHLACHCACHIVALPAVAARRIPPIVHPAAFSAAPSHASRPGLIAPPSEPPRT